MEGIHNLLEFLSISEAYQFLLSQISGPILSTDLESPYQEEKDHEFALFLVTLSA